MGLFNNIIKRKTEGSSTMVNYDIVLSEYARKKDLANYFHKGRRKKTKKKKKKKKNERFT